MVSTKWTKEEREQVVVKIVDSMQKKINEGLPISKNDLSWNLWLIKACLMEDALRLEENRSNYTPFIGN